jgi:transcriptional regulator with XRE-family HTH domain
MSTRSRHENYSPGLYGLPHMGEVIASYRMKAGWSSREEFAVVCGVDKQTIAYWENQRYLADMNRRIFLCKLLNIPPALLGLTYASLIDKDNMAADTRSMSEFLQENAYALYEDILNFAHTSTAKYSPTATYRFLKHQQELEHIAMRVPEIEKDAWLDLLSRFYQHSTFIAQHYKKDEEALSLANKAVSLAEPLQDAGLLGAALYRRSRIHLVQNRPDLARDDIKSALEQSERASHMLRGNCYLLSAEVNALYAQGDEKLRTQCRIWQDHATKLVYMGLEDDGNFMQFNLYATHHERAKTLLRFALFYTTDEELVEQLKITERSANKALLRDAGNAINTAKKHIEENKSTGDITTGEMNLSITEAKLYLIAREYEESAKVADTALQFAYKANSKQGVEEIKKLYLMLYQLAPKNPHIAHLGIALGIFPSRAQ